MGEHFHLLAMPRYSVGMRIFVLALLTVGLGCNESDGSPEQQTPIDMAQIDATSSDMAIPDILSPDMAQPDAVPPDMRIPDGALPDVVIPDMTPPDMMADSSTVSDVELPDMAFPDVELPDVAIPDVAIPDVAIPDVAIPDVAIPDVATPDMAPPIDPLCAPFDVPNNVRQTVYAHLSRTYRPINPRNDLGGRRNRYTTARFLMFTVIDRFTNDQDQTGIECVYTGRFLAVPPDQLPDNDDINCEHVWPRSRLIENRPGYSHREADLHHLHPSDARTNSARGNHFFGNPVSDLTRFRQATIGNQNGRRVFSPRPEKRGDIARAVMYMSVRWGLNIDAAEEAVLRQWVIDDPVDDDERARNAHIGRIQGNRNPFIDCPDLVERIDDFVDFPVQENLANP